MTIWAGLIVSRVLRLADSLVQNGRAADDMLRGTIGPRLELAEPLSHAAAMQGIEIPRTDENLRLFLAVRNTAAPLDLNMRGLVLRLVDGRLGLSIGKGRVIESRGAGLSVVIAPEPGRYSEAFAVPGVQLLGGA